MLKFLCQKEFSFKENKLLKSVRKISLCIFTLFLTTYVTANTLVEKTVTLNLKNVQLKTVIAQIEKQTDYLFVYDEQNININRNTSINAKNNTVEDVLKKILAGTNVIYSIEGKNIVLKLNPPQDTNEILPQQNIRSITGVVSDSDGNPIVGATIKVDGTSTGTLSDLQGKFVIDVPSNGRLIISYVGYITRTVPVQGQNNLVISIFEDTKTLDEVVVIGYGVQKRSDLTGSIASIKSEDIEKFPTSNVTEMLRGQAAGVQVTLSNPAPGGTSNILVRGSRSLSSSQTPLYLVDGMIVPHINDLNSSDVSSIEVLKDASSQAIYGARASNGVILITTKRGQEGKFTIDLNSYVGTQRFVRNFDFYTPEEWVTLRFWAKYNDGNAGIGTIDDIDYQTVLDDPIMYDAFINKKYTNWENELFSNSLQQKYDLSLRAGGEKIKLATSIGYYNQDGIVIGSGYDRTNFRLNTDYAPLKWVDIGFNFSYAQSNRQNADATFNEVITMPGLSQAYDVEGELMRETTTSGNINPIWRNREYDSKQRDEYLTLSTFANLKLFKNFSYRISANIRSNNREEGNYRTVLYPGSTGEGGIRNFHRSSWMIDNVINYEIPFSDKIHKASVTLIQSSEEDIQRTTGYDFINAPTDLFGWNVAADSEVTNVVRAITRTRSVSFAARLQYNLLDRYLLTASLRRDGVSVFGPENKWATFPSMALAWRINEEGFLKDQQWLDMLKYRISYGVVGNWAIPSYRTLGLAESQEYLLDDKLVIGYLPSNSLQNLGLKWENTASFNTGVDFSIFNGKLSGTFEYYLTHTNDLLINRIIPSISGYANMWDNLGKTQSNGIELTLNSQIVNTRNFSWNIGGTFSKQKNEIIAIDGRTDEDGNYINSGNYFIGYSINAVRDYVFGGIWQEGEEVTQDHYLPGNAEPKPGDVKILDYNGDGVITVDDRKIYDLDPSWYASFNTAVNYKGIDLQMEFYTVQNIIKTNPYLYAYNQGGSLNGKLNGMRVNYWTPDNKSNSAPRPQFTASVPHISLLGFQDASYFRMRSATLGYTLPQKLTRRVNIDKLRFYVTGTNLFTITDFKSYSPELTASNYPEAQSFILGLNLTF